MLLPTRLQASCLPTGSTTGNWFPDGPPISHLPFPVLDEEKRGHYTTLVIDTENEEDKKKIIKPPSVVLKERFSELGGSVTESSLHGMKSILLLKKCQCGLITSVICKNRQRGAKKAAETRRLRSTKATSRTVVIDTSVQESREDQRQHVDGDDEHETDQEPRKEHKQQGHLWFMRKDYD